MQSQAFNMFTLFVAPFIFMQQTKQVNGLALAWRGCHNNRDFGISFSAVNVFKWTENSQTFPNARSDGFLLSSQTERNVIKYQGHGDTGIWVAFCASADSMCDVAQ